MALSPAAEVATDSSLALRLAAVAAERELPIARGALHRLADKMPPPPDPWPVETRQALVRVLLRRPPAIDALESLDQRGLLVRLLPEWAAVRNRPQRNAYHRFTVDRHLLEAAANAAELADRVERPDLLVVGALLHDIGKGYPGDHTEVGIELIGVIGRRMGFPPGDVAVAGRALPAPPAAARHRHPARPRRPGRPSRPWPRRSATADPGAAGCPDRGRQPGHRPLGLGELEGGPGGRAGGAGRPAPRRAGSGAEPVGGSAWLTDLHRSIMDEVRASGHPAVRARPAPGHRGRPRPPRPAGLGGRRRWPSTASTCAAPMSPARTGWPSRSSPSRSAGARGPTPPACARTSTPCSRTAWPSTTAWPPRPRTTPPSAGRRRPGRWSPEVIVDNDASASSTVVEVRAPDEVGLLHRVTQALFDCDLDVVSARVSTIGDDVVDAFYVRDADGGQGHRPEALARIEARTARAAVS